jgi:DNA-binding response OmpR family regulator
VPLIAISGYAFSGAEGDDPACLKMALGLGATRYLRKPFRPSTLLGLIDECLSEAEPHRRHAATLSAVANVLSEPRLAAMRPLSRGPLRAELPDTRLCRLRQRLAGGKRRGFASSQKNRSVRIRT